MGVSRKVRATRRRRRRMALVEHDLTAAQWQALTAAWGGCAYCGVASEALQRDCVLPISRGGRYTLANVVPACRSCNASKCNDEVTGWLRRKHLDEGGFLLRHHEIRTALMADALRPAAQHPAGAVAASGSDATAASSQADAGGGPLRASARAADTA